MKNTMRCLGVIALVALIGFALVACDNGMTSELDGNWESTYGMAIRMSGGGAVITRLPTTGYWGDAANKGYIRINSQKFRNIRKTGNYTWEGENLIVRYSGSSATGIEWQSTTISLSSNNQTFTTYNSGNSTGSWTRR